MLTIIYLDTEFNKENSWMYNLQQSDIEKIKKIKFANYSIDVVVHINVGNTNQWIPCRAYHSNSRAGNIYNDLTLFICYRSRAFYVLDVRGIDRTWRLNKVTSFS